MDAERIGYLRDQSWPERWVRQPLFWVIFCTFLFAYPVYRSMNRKLPPTLPKYSKVAPYSLTNEFGKPFGSNELKGKFYLANFMFTSCPTVCPALMKKMQKVQKRVRGLGTKIAIVSFSVDPVNDTPKKLFKYARELQTNPHVWNFLTGPRKDLEEILVKEFKVPMGEYESIERSVDNQVIELMDIAHSEKIVLVDEEGYIRGYYSTDKNGINKLMIDLGLMVNDLNYKKS